MKNKKIKELLKDFFPKPPFTVRRDILAPSQTKHWPLVGTAFDYLLRFFIEKHNPQSHTVRWIAEEALEILKDKKYKRVYKEAKAVVKKAHENYKAYLDNGVITDHLLTSVIQLAYLDIIFRAEKFPETWQVDQLDLQDLRNLISIVDPKIFHVKKECFLNPKLAGGATDADLIIDGKLIDIKTVKEFKLRREMFDQLIKYYTFQYIENMKNPKREITHLGIYFSRYAYLHLYDVSEIIDHSKFPKFLERFVQIILSQNT